MRREIYSVKIPLSRLFIYLAFTATLSFSLRKPAPRTGDRITLLLSFCVRPSQTHKNKTLTYSHISRKSILIRHGTLSRCHANIYRRKGVKSTPDYSALPPYIFIFPEHSRSKYPEHISALHYRRFPTSTRDFLTPVTSIHFARLYPLEGQISRVHISLAAAEVKF